MKVNVDTGSKIYVEADGPVDAKIVLIGECPAKNEVFAGRPFVGEAGQNLDRFLNLAGMNREELYITNVAKVRAPMDKMHKMSQDDLQMWRENLIQELNDLPEPSKIIVPMGNYALQTVSDASGITKNRGTPIRPKSVLKNCDVVVPTFHPVSVGYAGKYENWILIVADLVKANQIANQESRFEFPTWRFIVQPTYEQVMETLSMLEETLPDLVVLDIENPNNVLTCIGLAWSREDAISIPFIWGNGRDYWTFEQEIAIWNRLAEVLPKQEMGAQNVLFDWRVLREHELYLPMLKWDSMLMHLCLYSEMRHRLDVITSIYTNLPYYKTDEDEERGSSLKAGKEKDHWIYNMYDCVGTLWAIEELKNELIEENMLDVYISLYAEVLPPIFEMNMRGTPVDVDGLAKVHEESTAMIKTYNEEIKEETGIELNANSPKQVADLLYNQMNMSRYKGEKTAKKTLEKLAYKYNSDIPTKIIEIRAARKELGLFSETNVLDGFVKCEYSLSRTNTGRFASRKERGRGGMNLQNVKRGAQRKFFIALPGHVLVGGDQKQAEAQCVGWYAQDEGMMSLSASGESMHVAHGKRVYGPDFDKSHPAYVIVKGLVHGSNYGLGWFQFARMTNLPASEAKAHLQDYHDRYPGIRQTFHKYVEREISRCRTLYNPFGRRQVFLGRLDRYSRNKVFQAGYAFMPQSCVSDINKIALKRVSKHYIVLLELHDGLILSVPEKEVELGIEALQEAYDVPFKIWDEEHTIPIEVSVGDNWNDMQEIKI